MTLGYYQELSKSELVRIRKRDAQRRFKSRHKNQILEESATYRALNREKLREESLIRYHKHSKEKALKLKIKRESIRNGLLSLLGMKCLKCGFSDKRALQFDHINGGGNNDRLKFNDAYKLYEFYLNRPELASKELQILCANCNWIKKDENKEKYSKYI